MDKLKLLVAKRNRTSAQGHWQSFESVFKLADILTGEVIFFQEQM
jgi:hypothetical protein